MILHESQIDRIERYQYRTADGREATIEFINGEFYKLDVRLSHNHWSLEEIEFIASCYQRIEELRSERQEGSAK